MGFVFVIASIVAALIHLALKRPQGRAAMVDVFLLYSLVINVGFVGFFYGFIPHVFFPDMAAELIGWETGSHFQFESASTMGPGASRLSLHRYRDRFWLTGLNSRSSCSVPHRVTCSTRSERNYAQQFLHDLRRASPPRSCWGCWRCAIVALPWSRRHRE